MVFINCHKFFNEKFAATRGKTFATNASGGAI